MADGTSGSDPCAGSAPGGTPGPHPGTPHLAIGVTVFTGTATVVLRGELGPGTMPVLARRLAQVLAEGPQRLVFDMAGIDFIDCACARLLTGTRRHLPGGARPAMLSASPAVRQVLTLTGLAGYLDIGGCGPQLPGRPSAGRPATRFPI